MLGDMVNKRAVRILLECILVVDADKADYAGTYFAPISWAPPLT